MNKVIEKDTETQSLPDYSLKTQTQAVAFLKVLETEEMSISAQYQVIESMRRLLVTRSRKLSDLLFPIEIIKENAYWQHSWAKNLELVIKNFEKKDENSD